MGAFDTLEQGDAKPGETTKQGLMSVTHIPWTEIQYRGPTASTEIQTINIQHTSTPIYSPHADIL